MGSIGRHFYRTHIGLVLFLGLVVALGIDVRLARAQMSEAIALYRQSQKLSEQGRYSEATPLAQRELAILEKTLGPNHPDVATSLNKLAALYLN
jgi:hypothetical protein